MILSTKDNLEAVMYDNESDYQFLSLSMTPIPIDPLKIQWFVSKVDAIYVDNYGPFSPRKFCTCGVHCLYGQVDGFNSTQSLRKEQLGGEMTSLAWSWRKS